MINEKRSVNGPCILSLVCANDRKEVITFQELTCGLIPVNGVSEYMLPSLINQSARKEI